jgi:hypothetical protein
MSRTSTYARSGDGLVHLVSPITGGEFTLCGDSWDISETETDADGSSWIECKPCPITCPKCAECIEACRGVRISPAIDRNSLLRREAATGRYNES